jgi:hypothetical protein
MAERSNEKAPQRGSQQTLPLEAGVELMREKTTRLKALRLAQKGAAVGVDDSVAPVGYKKKRNKPSKNSQSLTDWLATQQNEGRRS